MADSLSELRSAALRFRDERDWKQFHRPKDLALGLSIEAGELGELLLWKTAPAVEAALRDPAHVRRVAEEMADVLLFLLYLSDATGVALGDAVLEKLRINAEKYPVDRFRGSARKYDAP